MRSRQCAEARTRLCPCPLLLTRLRRLCSTPPPPAPPPLRSAALLATSLGVAGWASVAHRQPYSFDFPKRLLVQHVLKLGPGALGPAVGRPLPPTVLGCGCLWACCCWRSPLRPTLVPAPRRRSRGRVEAERGRAGRIPAGPGGSRLAPLKRLHGRRARRRSPSLREQIPCEACLNRNMPVVLLYSLQVVPYEFMWEDAEASFDNIDWEVRLMVCGPSPVLLTCVAWPAGHTARISPAACPRRHCLASSGGASFQRPPRRPAVAVLLPPEPPHPRGHRARRAGAPRHARPYADPAGPRPLAGRPPARAAEAGAGHWAAGRLGRHEHHRWGFRLGGHAATDPMHACLPARMRASS